MQLKVLNAHEISQLEACIKEMGSYHNNIAIFSPGIYPLAPFEKMLSDIAEQVSSGKSFAAALVQNNDISGFIKISIDSNLGSIDLLYVKEHVRGQGNGRKLVDWAISIFKEKNVRLIDLKILLGNDAAKRFYEKCGFKVRSEVMSMLLEN